MLDQEYDKKKMIDLIKRLRDLEDKFGRELNKPNVFVAAGLVQQEIRHSSILAFLLDPNEWHGIGDYFLRQLLSIASDDHHDALKIALCDLDDIRILTEVPIHDSDTKMKGRLDILAHAKKEKIILAIENKIGAQEGENQLKKYRMWLHEKYKDYIILLIYLTIDGEEPSDAEWFPLKYSELIDELADATAVKSHLASEEGIIYINNYINLVERFVMKKPNEKLSEICKILWKDYGDLLDQINEYRPTPFIDAANYFFDDEKELTKISLIKSDLHFIPKCLENKVKLSAMRGNFWGWGKESYGMHLCMEFRENKKNGFTLRLAAYVGPIEDTSTRSKLINDLGSIKEMRPEGKERLNTTSFTRVWGWKTKELTADDAKDIDILKKGMQDLMKEFSYCDKISEALVNFSVVS